MTSSSSSKTVNSVEAWGMLAEDPDTVLVDVRTMVEWAYVGLPNLTSIGKDVVTIEWSKLTGQQNMAFAQQLMAQVPKDKTVLFICRAGLRSHSAAMAALLAGYAAEVNVEEGFDC
ncbi:MAG: rhodanese-like domain-containing protein, partial [Alphaproteobacteria bacterium]|nr:rhodanese-like domain-containing protein [Alphaproteobacteria bacterium]